MVTLLVACDENYGIGKSGKIPWHIPLDLKLFKQRTTGHVVIMGRKTWNSLPIKPLPNRVNIILSRKLSSNNNFLVTRNPNEAIELASKIASDKEIFVIGGADIYNVFLSNKLVDRMIVSHIKGEHEADTFFKFPEDWAILNRTHYKSFDVIEYIKA